VTDDKALRPEIDKATKEILKAIRSMERPPGTKLFGPAARKMASWVHRPTFDAYLKNKKGERLAHIEIVSRLEGEAPTNYQPGFGRFSRFSLPSIHVQRTGYPSESRRYRPRKDGSIDVEKALSIFAGYAIEKAALVEKKLQWNKSVAEWREWALAEFGPLGGVIPRFAQDARVIVTAGSAYHGIEIASADGPDENDPHAFVRLSMPSMEVSVEDAKRIIAVIRPHL
jgi:hypothetical protein